MSGGWREASSVGYRPAQLQAAHSPWTADWLGWERTHDADYTLKAALLAHVLGDAATGAEERARLNAMALQALLPR